jgi:hypothetical protein
MNGPRNLGPQYTGKHRRENGPGVLPPAWGSRPEPHPRSAADSRPVPGGSPLPGAGAVPLPGVRPEPGPWPDAG